MKTTKSHRKNKNHTLPTLSSGFTPTAPLSRHNRLPSPSSTNDQNSNTYGNTQRPSSPATPRLHGRHNDRHHREECRKSRNSEQEQDNQTGGAPSFESSSTAEDAASKDTTSNAEGLSFLGRFKQSGLATPLSSRQPVQNELSTHQSMQENVVPTPPIQEEDRILFSRPRVRRGISSIPSRLTTVDSATGQDGSLPSPSLSPVTAAANLNRHHDYFADTDSVVDPALQHDNDVDDLGIYLSDTPSRASMVTARQSPVPRPLQENHERPPLHTFNDIPAMLDFFEAIPDQFKSWVMHQLLRRCPKKTLHMVAEVVNPTLKCDFLGALPLELSLNILQYLDVKSLCRASQVSRKWRHVINNDEKAWKELIERDGFTLADGELQRAILEGWGWQDPSGPSGWEQDLSGRSDSEGSRPNTPYLNMSQSNDVAESSTRRPKRKATTKMSNRNKQAKMRETPRDDTLSSSDVFSELSLIEGPYKAAQAARDMVHNPRVDIPSLRDLHLYKSLYRRHYLIKQSWMQDDVKPRHIAFRAHDRHVVTCLQFDTDKIITGSDDTNINVYDTKTGRLRAKLQGHEGGVWALQYEDNILVSGSTDRSVRVWDIEKGRQMQVFQGHTSTVRCLQILLPSKVGETLDGKPVMMPKQPLIITGSRDSFLRVWKLPQPGDPYYYQAGPAQSDRDCPYFVRSLAGHQHSVRAIAAHADTLVSGSYDSTVRVWKISTGETVWKLTGHTQKVYSVVYDHERNRCISGSMDNQVKIWSLELGTCLHTLDGHSSLVGLLDLNSDRLVSAAADSTLRIWDPDSGQCKATLTAHTGAITCFQHDGQKVISGSDKTLKMWNVKTGECVKDLLTDLSGVWQVKFNDRRCVAAVQRDNMTYIEVSWCLV